MQGVNGRQWSSSRLGVWLAGNSVRVVLFGTGLLLVLGAVYMVPNRQAVASTLTAAGTALIAFGALLPYIEGPFAFGPFRGHMAVPLTSTKDPPPTTAAPSDALVRVSTVTAAAHVPAPTVTTTREKEEGDA